MLVLMALGPITLILCITGLYLVYFLRGAETTWTRFGMPILINVAIAAVLVGIAIMFGVLEFYTRLDNYLRAALHLLVNWIFWSAHIWIPLMAFTMAAMEVFKKYRTRL